MKINNFIHVLGSGDSGFSLSHPEDCTVYLIDGKSEMALIDAGCGLGTEAILQEIRASGFDPKLVSAIFLTHGHGDHAGGARVLHENCHAEVYAMEPAATYIREGNLQALSIEPAIEAGIYPKDYTFPKCPVTALHENEFVDVGSIRVYAHKTEGHCAGHACYSVLTEGERFAFVGDAITNGGKISLQAIWDCDLQAYLSSIKKISNLNPDGIFPGHGCFSLTRGMRQVNYALERIRLLKLPINAIE